ncbi:MAG: hypothetical protein V1887_03595 [Candidatus Aenigmatarchaeota archaeon]
MKTFIQTLNMMDLRKKQNELSVRLPEMRKDINCALILYRQILRVEEYMRDTLANAGDNATSDDLAAYHMQQQLRKRAEEEARNHYDGDWDKLISQPASQQKS